MKYFIFNKARDKRKDVKAKNDLKNLAELLVFAFSMCAITILVIFASLDFDGEIDMKEKSEYVSLICKSEAYEIFDLNLLENNEIVGGVSGKEKRINDKTVLSENN
ncbi:MAG: hypothetical protein IJ437_00425 [Clostridia bacterium]|nr:hypothetical protein [Clostridia bacterium]